MTQVINESFIREWMNDINASKKEEESRAVVTQKQR